MGTEFIVSMEDLILSNKVGIFQNSLRYQLHMVSSYKLHLGSFQGLTINHFCIFLRFLMVSLIFINMQISYCNKSHQERKSKTLILIWHQFEASIIKTNRIIKKFGFRENHPTVVMVTISKLNLTSLRSLYFTRLFFGNTTDIQLSDSNKIISVLFSPRLSLILALTDWTTKVYLKDKTTKEN